MTTAALQAYSLRTDIISEISAITDLDILKKISDFISNCYHAKTEEAYDTCEYIEKEELIDMIREGLSEYKTARDNDTLSQMKTLQEVIDEL